MQARARATAFAAALAHPALPAPLTGRTFLRQVFYYDGTAQVAAVRGRRVPRPHSTRVGGRLQPHPGGAGRAERCRRSTHDAPNAGHAVSRVQDPDRGVTVEYDVQVSFLEIYNERVRDLFRTDAAGSGGSATPPPPPGPPPGPGTPPPPVRRTRRSSTTGSAGPQRPRLNLRVREVCPSLPSPLRASLQRLADAGRIVTAP